MPSFQTCEGILITILAEGVVAICDTAEFYVFFAINKEFRQMVFSSVPLCQKFVAEKVSTPNQIIVTSRPV